MKSEKYFLYVLRTNAPTYRCQRVPYPISNFSVVFLTKGKIVKGKHFPAYWLLLYRMKMLNNMQKNLICLKLFCYQMFYINIMKYTLLVACGEMVQRCFVNLLYFFKRWNLFLVSPSRLVDRDLLLFCYYCIEKLQIYQHSMD